jgi:hypothetical protein
LLLVFTGSNDTTVGGAGLTVIWLATVEPLRLALIWLVPGILVYK